MIKMRLISILQVRFDLYFDWQDIFPVKNSYYPDKSLVKKLSSMIYGWYI